MEADIELLPKRVRTENPKFPGGRQTEFYSNYYTVILEKRSIYYQFSFSSEPQIPATSSQVLYEAIRSIKKDLKEEIDLFGNRGYMLWGLKPLKIPKNFIAKFKFKEVDHQYNLLIKPAKTITPADLMEDRDTANKVLQMLNVSLKKKLKNMNMRELGRGRFYEKRGFEEEHTIIREANLRVIRGYQFTLCLLSNKLALQIDVCSRILRIQNFHETMMRANLSKSDVIDKYEGSIVITRYGNYRTYKIEKLDYDKTPNSTFFHEKDNTEYTFTQYFKKSYGYTIRYPNERPLILAISERREIKDGKMIRIQDNIYLVPEMVGLTGMSDEQRADRNIMKDIAPKTKLSPQDRVDETQRLIDDLNKEEGELTINKALKVPGFIMPETTLLTKKIMRVENGIFNLREPIKDSTIFDNVLFVYSLGKNSKYDDKDADQAVEMIQNSMKCYDVKFKNPGFLTIEGRGVAHWINSIKDDVQKNGKPQIVILFFTPQEDKFYGKLKNFITKELQCPSQAIMRRSLSSRSKNAMSVASKIGLQMCAKIGSVLWEVQKKHEYFKNRKLMYGAFSTSKSKRNYSLGFVGTLNSESTKLFSSARSQIKKKQEIPRDIFESIMKLWARKYYETNKAVPDTIIIYREGLSEAQIKAQVRQEIEALESVIKIIGEKTKVNNYKPQIVYISATKKINSRIFSSNTQGGGGKFRPKVSNPEPGSVVLDAMSVNHAYDFHLAAQRVTQGTCTPTRYQVVYDNKGRIPIEALVQFTNEQCYNYYNWCGAVRVPACLQSADKLAKLVGEHVQDDISEGEILKKPWFL